MSKHTPRDSARQSSTTAALKLFRREPQPGSTKVSKTFWVPSVSDFCKSLRPWLLVSEKALMRGMNNYKDHVDAGKGPAKKRPFLTTSDGGLLDGLYELGIIPQDTDLIKAVRLTVALKWMTVTFRDTEFAPVCKTIVDGINCVFAYR